MLQNWSYRLAFHQLNNGVGNALISDQLQTKTLLLNQYNYLIKAYDDREQGLQDLVSTMMYTFLEEINNERTFLESQFVDINQGVCREMLRLMIQLYLEQNQYKSAKEIMCLVAQISTRVKNLKRIMVQIMKQITDFTT